MRAARPLTGLLTLMVAATLLPACGDASTGDPAGGDRRPRIVVTTTILGDVVRQVVGEQADVVVLMPPGADPHDVQLSARQTAEIREADALVTNGGDFEAGMLDSLDAAEGDGVPTHHAIDSVATLEPSDGGGGDSAVDPHFFTDPDRVAEAAEDIAAFLEEEVDGLSTESFRAGAAAAVADLRDLATEVEEILSVIPAEDRVLVTNHEVFGYFADRYAFEVVGTVIPGGGTQAEPSAAGLSDLAGVIEEEGVPAIFADVSSPRAVADALAAEVGPVEVIALYSESLGEKGSEADTYAGMQRTNAHRITTALT